MGGVKGCKYGVKGNNGTKGQIHPHTLCRACAAAVQISANDRCPLCRAPRANFAFLRRSSPALMRYENFLRGDRAAAMKSKLAEVGSLCERTLCVPCEY